MADGGKAVRFAEPPPAAAMDDVLADELAIAKAKIAELEAQLMGGQPAAAGTPLFAPPLASLPPMPPPAQPQPQHPPQPPAQPPKAVPVARDVPPSAAPAVPEAAAGEQFMVCRDVEGEDDNLSISSCNTSLGVPVNDRRGDFGDSDSDAPAPRRLGKLNGDDNDDCGRSRSRSRASSRSSRARSSRGRSGTGRPGELATVVPESEFLDIHRMDVSKVVSVHRHYEGALVPHYLSFTFDEGDSVNPGAAHPVPRPDELLPFAKVTAQFTNRSRKKSAADIVKYPIYVAQRTGGSIYDASTVVYNAAGECLGMVACIFGNVTDPSYVVQDFKHEVEDEDAPDEDAVYRCDVDTVLYTTAVASQLLFEGPSQDPLAAPAAPPADASAPRDPTTTVGADEAPISAAYDKLKRRYHQPGCDASHLDDEELPFEKHEFSDDEKEREAKLDKKKRKHPGDQNRIGLLDMLEEDSDDESNKSEYEFNDDGEIIGVLKQSDPSRKRQKTARGQRKAAAGAGVAAPPPGGPPSLHPTAAPLPHFIPPPPPLQQGDPTKVFVQDVPIDTSWHALAAIMGAAFGNVEEAVVKVKTKKGKVVGQPDKAFAFVKFQDAAAARQAVFVSKILSPCGNIMRVMPSRPERIRRQPEGDLPMKGQGKQEKEPQLPPRPSPEAPAAAAPFDVDADLEL
eukprot:TRINITY_DN11312_c0_g1_i1.p1 TRINITY_DN11312_c0_g1~~TRINITY_DN11312_c0_g1_i1.p1  ORF type:complete len:680 (+),score=260.78 TRINITY_DN11312_c0_g1_i1:224-2263(+)